MKAGELMINDWVRHNGVPVKVYYIVVGDDTEIIPLHNPKTNEYNGTHACNLEPVPLTGDILVKNGWSKVVDGAFCTYSAPNFPTLWTFHGGAFIYNLTYNKNIDINYVHQLQHLLRLWEVEKELVL